MDPSDVMQLLTIFILLGLSAFFSSAETALTMANTLRITTLAEEGNKKAKTVLKVTDDSGKMLSAILIGNNLVNIFASSLTTTLTISLGGNAYIGAATGALTLLVLIFGEITPKTAATVNAEKIALNYAGIIYFLMKLLTPLIFLVNKLARGLMWLLRIDPDAKTSALTEQELRTMVNVSHEDGVIEKEEREMICNVFDFGEAQAKDIMVPRIDMIFVSVDATYEELMQIFKEEGYTRLPVYETSTDTIIGILNMKDLLLYDRSNGFSLRDLLRKPYFTYEHKRVSSLLLEMKKQSNNFAIVLDEYGATSGLITMEDLVEEIVGEIRDEYDEGEEEILTTLVPGREYIALGSAKLDDLNDLLAEELEHKLDSEDYDSIGGYVIEQLDHLPELKESVTTPDGLTLVVDELDKNRIGRVHIYLPEKKETTAEEDK